MSVLEAFAGKSRYASRGQRVVVGQRLMQAASDLFLGWSESRGALSVTKYRSILGRLLMGNPVFMRILS